MGLLSTEVEVGISNNLNYYESLGYKIPKHYDKKHARYCVKRGTTILVKVSDLQHGSHALVEVECDICKKKYSISYKTYLNYLHDDGVIYCNKCACKLFNSGMKNHMWNKDLTEEERIIKRNYPEYTKFVKSVLHRDSYTCQCCQNTSVYLEVHHLDGYSWCKEKRLDLNNAITLCKKCHDNFHFTYGKEHNTKEQFEEWFGHTLSILKNISSSSLPTTRKIYCVEDDIIYDSAKEITKIFGTNISDIYKSCHYRIGGTAKGKHYMWADELNGMNQNEALDFINKQRLQHILEIEEKHNVNKKINNVTKPVICLTTNEVFVSSCSAAKHYDKESMQSKIRECCKGNRETAGILSDGTKLTWMFYSDYLKMQKEKKYG